MLHRQAFAAFRTAALEHRAAVLGRHPCPESVLFGAAAVVWLKCPLRHNLAPSNSPESETLSLRKNAASVKVLFLAWLSLTKQALGIVGKVINEELEKEGGRLQCAFDIRDEKGKGMGRQDRRDHRRGASSVEDDDDDSEVSSARRKKLETKKNSKQTANVTKTKP